MMKKLCFLIFALLAFSIAQALQVELTQRVSRRENTQTWNVRGSYSKDVSRKKTFYLKITNMSTIDVVAIFFASVGGDVYSEVISDTITPKKPLTFEYSGSASSNKANYAALGVKTRAGNDKVEACVFVYDKKTGKLIGQKYTSKFFADSVREDFKDAIDSTVKEYQNNQESL